MNKMVVWLKRIYRDDSRGDCGHTRLNSFGQTTRCMYGRRVVDESAGMTQNLFNTSLLIESLNLN
jgi:hypothetical protein